MEKPEETEDTLTREVWYPFLKRARDFRNERLGKIRTGKIWSPMSGGPYCVLHWIPMPTMSQQSMIDSFRKSRGNDFIIFGQNGLMSFQENLNDFLSIADLEDRGEWQTWVNEWQHYKRGFQRTQIFHSGEIEAVYAPYIDMRITQGQKRQYVSLFAFEFFRKQIKNCIKKTSILGFSDAVVIEVSMINLQDCSIYTPITTGWHIAQFYTSLSNDEVLNSPKSNDVTVEIRNEDFATLKGKEEEAMGFIFDRLWNHFGLIKCDRNWEDGSWEFKTHL